MRATNRTVFVSGNFNILHPGHLRLLRFARECGNHLIVGVQSDRLAGEGAHVPEQLRYESVQSNAWVDEVILIDEQLVDVLRRVKPDIIVKGKEHENSFNVELIALNEYGGQLLFNSGESTFSSLDLIRKEFREFQPCSIHLPREFMERHSISSEKLIKLIDNFSKLKICVVGDLIVDEYITCQPLGMSQEDPTIVVTPIDSMQFIGGAGIVAAHAAGMGANARFVSVTGADAARGYALSRLQEAGVHATLLVDESRPTTLKQRYRSNGKSLLRVSHLHQSAISKSLQNKMLESLEDAMDGVDVLVFSDFNYGCLPQSMVDQVILMARSRRIILAADSQSSSQVGDVSRFRGMDLLTPTEREARISLRNHEDGLVIISQQLRRQADAHNLLLKLGEEGLFIHNGDSSDHEWQTDRLNPLNAAPKDVSGAGDSLLIASAMTLASGGDLWDAACIGSLAAAVQVSRVGNTPIHRGELLKEIGAI